MQKLLRVKAAVCKDFSVEKRLCVRALPCQDFFWVKALKSFCVTTFSEQNVLCVKAVLCKIV